MKMSKITYFEKPGITNTIETLKIAKGYAGKKGIRSVVVASTRGFTATKAAKLFKGFNLIVVTHVSSMKTPNTQEFSSNIRKSLEAEGVKVITTAHAFSGVNVLAGGSIGEIIKKTL